MDNYKNFSASSVSTAPTPALSGTTMTLRPGEGSRMASPPFNAIVKPKNLQPTPENAEIVRVAAVAGDTLTILRAQEGTTAKEIRAGWDVYAGVTKKTIDDLAELAAGGVSSVNGLEGAVNLDTDDIPEGSTNRYHTDARAAAAAPVQSVAGKVGAVSLTKADVGLALVDNTSDANKPVSAAVKDELDSKVSKSGDTMEGSLSLDGSAAPRTLELSSSSSGGLNASDSTSRIHLESYQKAQLNNDSGTNTEQAHYGEVVRIDLKHKQAKGVIAFRENYLGSPAGARTVAWLVAHGEANDSTPQDPVWHNHFSIELPDENGALQTSLEFPFGTFNTPNAFGIPYSNFYVRSVVKLIAAGQGLLVEGGPTQNKDIRFANGTYNDTTKTRWGLQTDNSSESTSNAGSNFRINSYTDAGLYKATPLYIRRADSQVGISTTTPSAALDVVGSTELNGNVAVPTGNVSVGNASAQGGAKVYVETSSNQTGLLFRNTLGSGNTAANIVTQVQTAASRVLQAGVQSDTVNRLSIEGSGLIEWGPGGSSGRDTNLYRSAANTLKTDDTFVAGGGIDAGANRITSLADPASTQDAATKGYVDTQTDAIKSVVDVPSSTTDLDAFLTSTFLPSVPSTLGTGPNQNYRAPTLAEARSIINGLYLIAREAGTPAASIDTTDAAAILSPHGFTVTKGYDVANNRPYVLARAEVTYPSSSNYRAWGWFYFGMSAPVSMLVSAPHPQTDGNSEFIALRYAQRVPGALYALSSVNRKAKDYMVTEISTTATTGTFTLTFRGQTTAALPFSATPAQVQAALEALSTVGVGNVICTGDPVNTTLHCFANLNPSLYDAGNPTNTITGTSVDLDAGLTIDHDADVAHNYNSVFNKAIEAFARLGYAHLQLHGFSDLSSGAPRCFSGILSRGSSNTTILIEAIRTALEAQGFDIAVRDSYDTQGFYITGGATGGTFTLTCEGQTTGAISFSATPATLASNVQTALESLSTIGTGNIKVTVSQNSNGSVPTLVFTFAGALYHAGKQITIASNNLTGGTTPTPTMLTANGTALTAQSNTQGDIAEKYGTVFMHLELSATVRTSTTLSAKVVDALANTNIPQLSAAAMPVLAESGHSVSQSPLANGSAATIGTSPVAARADHRHPATNNTPTANQIIARNSGNTAWNATDPNTVATSMTNVVHTTGDETTTGIKTLTTDTSGNGLQILRATSTTGNEAKIGLRVSATTNNTSHMAEIAALRTDSPGSQDTAIVFRNRRGGSAASEVARFNTSGNLELPLAVPTNATDAVTKSYVDARYGLTARTASFTLNSSSTPYNTVNATSGNITVTLTATTTAGLIFTIKRLDASVNTVTVTGTATTIDGASSYSLNTQWKYVTLMSTTTSGAWLVVGGN